MKPETTKKYERMAKRIAESWNETGEDYWVWAQGTLPKLLEKIAKDKRYG